MRRVLISVEGQIEEIFVRDVLAPHLAGAGVALQQVILKTKRPAGAPAERGGLSTWPKVERELRLLLGDTNAVAVTTMYDLYGLPIDTPGWPAAHGSGDPRQRAVQIESAIEEAVGDRRLRAYIQVHEFEALVFAAPSQVAIRAGSESLGAEVAAIARSLGGPELVDDGPQTAPSKRLAALWPGYTKTLDGPAIVKASGLAAIRSQCPHLDAWISSLEDLGA